MVKVGMTNVAIPDGGIPGTADTAAGMGSVGTLHIVAQVDEVLASSDDVFSLGILVATNIAVVVSGLCKSLD